MKIQKPAKAGTMESNDIYIMVQPNDEGGVILNLESIVMTQFGNQIKTVIMETLKELGVEDAVVTAKDRGALDYTIRARIETAVKRGM
ncbi:citrate lyase subunit gamma [Fervidicella metallireducens AeB]|uniref:Citrate lyase subunit gamma n=1 Tax=Fervidicella metallireducens AeB TaxID=1403537 RepID=A0A017RX72_9CLOT|nr:citrate lyase acyl carrier protein [Fervidicella metallireducens]EYE88989.1 citrate lyase subunit gamma [Fervidicella metallireducens AeB]